MQSMTRAALFVTVFWIIAAGAGEVPSAVSKRFAELTPGAEPDRIDASEIPGVYEVWFGPSIYYISSNGRYLLRGDLIDLETKNNLTRERQSVARNAALEKLDEKGMIIFEPEKFKHTVTVFTDVDCPYCARFHEQMAGYNASGVRVRYLAFPRAGIPSPSYLKTVSVWCADDRRKAIGDAKAGLSVEKRNCKNPVADHYNAGQVVGVEGTPTIVLENGRVIPGFVPPARLLQMLEQAESG